ncbi:major facilitator superfamily domain-containing protein [Phascolomyces articulosus]|uniref:Major facilitator superfamily domain-containing protein n=1 Tax=Phascolomyces articulosus TaxID=60185 RepID=A0AAD5K900_9FUNG|nr:major facilitator superfamily domain-containing protein [Phascolomyces articulosus]
MSKDDTKNSNNTNKDTLDPIATEEIIVIDSSTVDNDDGDDDEVYCIHSKRKKLLITWITSLTALTSPLTGQIYYPSLTSISEEFNVSISLVNLSVTVYMISQAIAPSFWGPLSDVWGRRPIYLSTLTIFMAVCAGLAMVENFTALLVLRMVQAFGSSSAIALGAGVIGDIATPAERASYISIYKACRTAATGIGPTIGGLVAYKLEWRWVFWVLFIKGFIDLSTICFFVPETLRSLVGNGSGGYANPTPQQWLRKHFSKNPPPQPPAAKKDPSARLSQIPYMLLEQILFLRHPDVFLIMIINGSYMMITFALQTTISTHFPSIYHLNTLHVGLCYLPNAVGSIVGSFIIGKLLNRDFRTIAEKQGMTKDQVKKFGKLPDDFPIYQARLRSSWFHIILCQIVTVVYGWSLYAKIHIAVPLVMQFLAGMTVGSVTSVCQTLLVDLFPKRTASVTASSNLIRNAFSSVATATIQPGIENIGIGWMYTIFGLVLTTSTASIPILIKNGAKWRKNRAEQDTRRAK